MKKCSKCKQTKEYTEFSKTKVSKDGYCSYCKECTKEVQKRWRQEHPESMRRYWQRQNLSLEHKVRIDLYLFMRRNKIKKGACVVCKSSKVQAHHEDYSKPYEIVWLCRKHHEDVHHNGLIIDKSKVVNLVEVTS